MARIALLSVSNKEGLVPLAEALTKTHDFKLISSGGTARVLQQANIPVTKVSDYTGAQEILGGRVKTLHPRIHGGILAKRGDADHKSDLEKEKINAIELVVVNLYPFQETVSDPTVDWEKAIENIDIGGPTMIRAAAKNHESVMVLTNPSQYETFLENLQDGEVSKDMRKKLALRAFEHTAKYDIAISQWLGKQSLSNSSPFLKELPLKQELRYGENPHQNANWYSSSDQGWGEANQLQGKELSTNNLLDLEAAISTIREFGYATDQANNANLKAAVIIKHTNPCGVATSKDLVNAFTRALEGDPVSAFGGIVALNSCVDVATAKELTSLFIECVVAPGFEKEAKEILKQKTNLRVIEMSQASIKAAERNYVRSILGGMLVQEIDDYANNTNEWVVATTQKPSIEEHKDLEFAWNVARHVRSNAIVIASKGQTIGIGAGQMNRVGAAKIALETAGEKAKGAVLASDGFFPFDDTVKLAISYGVKAIIQPGGSIRDELSIKACNDSSLAMILTGRRHFLH